MSDLAKKLSSLDSASYCLVPGDLDRFQPGRTKNDILKDVKWRGDFYMAAKHDGKVVCAIVYELLPGGAYDNGGVCVWAIFVDDKFVKFVKQPQRLPGDNEDGTFRTSAKPLKAGDARFLIRGLNGEPVSIEDLKREVKSATAPPPSQVDPGLTAAYLFMRTIGLAPGPGPPPREKDYLRNAELRDKFNAARLNIGMTEVDVEAVVKAKPLESGKVEAGLYRIYGSDESINVEFWLRAPHVLVIFREGKATTISNIPGGHDWRQELGKATIDLPAPPRP